MARKSQAHIVQTLLIIVISSLMEGYDLFTRYDEDATESDRGVLVLYLVFGLVATGLSIGNDAEEILPTVKPNRSLFHPSLILSILSQVATHIGFTTLVTRAAKHGDRADQKTILNTALLLLFLTQNIATSLTNYAGRPFKLSIPDNTFLVAGMAGVMTIVFSGIGGLSGSLARYMKLTPLPDRLKKILTVAVCGELFGTFVLSRIAEAVFDLPRLEARTAPRPPWVTAKAPAVDPWGMDGRP